MEYITANGTEYECQKVTTTTNSIVFTLEMDATTAKSTFNDVSSLTVAGEDKAVYGTYDNLKFAYAMVDEDGNVTVCMRIKTELECQVESLEARYNEQEEIIATLMFGEV